ncbi:MAG: glycosyltransferase family 39 protein [Crocosphaera sp.]|nr:glycosyltransferase family 39 protein [Crocosphaera sp.]
MSKLNHRWLLLLIVVLLIGISLRFINLDKKVYWHDETYTLLWISGHSPQEVKKELFTGRVFAPDDILKFQRINPDRTAIDTISLLAKHDPHHPPLYYCVSRLFAPLFGDSTVSIRRFGAMLSLLCLPLSYWLGFELFGSHLIAGTLTVLTAVSPFHIVYAQEAREYSLWIATILFSNIAFLRAVRKPSKFAWILYSLGLTMGLYTFPFTAMIICAHGIYLFALKLYRAKKILFGYLASVISSIVLFLPWIVVIAKGFSVISASNAWSSINIPVKGLVYYFLENAGRTLFIFELDRSTSLSPPLITKILVLITFGFLVFSLYFLCRNTPRRIWFFILISGGFTAFSLLLSDLLFGGIRSTINRYMIPAWLSIQIIFCFSLSSVLRANERPEIPINCWWERVKKPIVSIVFLLIFVSDFLILQSDIPWVKYHLSATNPETARIINQYERPLVISSYSTRNRAEVLSLSQALEPEVRLLLLAKEELPNIPQDFENIFLFDPSKTIVKYFDDSGRLGKSIYKDGKLWQIKPK